MSHDPSHSQSSPSAGRSEPPRNGQHAVMRLERLWLEGHRPDLLSFILAEQVVEPARLADLVRIDQRHRWQRGEQPGAEDYLAAIPALAANAESALDVIFHEYLWQAEQDRNLDLDAFVARFKAFEYELRAQIALHWTMEESLDDSLSSDSQSPGDDESGDAVADKVNEALTRPEGNLDSTRIGDQRSSVVAGDDILPRSFGRYLLERIVGQGGMGTVYAAMDTQLQRRVALKQPRFEGRNHHESRQRFYREARITANLSHANLCPIHDLGEHDGIPFLTMPLITGDTLSTYLRREGPLPPSEAVDLVYRAALAVAAAHAAGVVHRDLKPSNIMVNDRLEPIVMDFGLARCDAPTDPRLTGSGGWIGTPAYLAPELVGGSASHDTERQGDIYSLGVVLYETITGHAPFTGTFSEVMKQVLTEEPLPLHERQEEVDTQLSAICARAMAKKPAQRYSTMDEFAAALNSWRTKTPHERSSATVFEGQTIPQTVSMNEKPAGLTLVTHKPASQPIDPPKLPRATTSWMVKAIASFLLLGLMAGLLWTFWPPTEVADAWQPPSVWQGRFQFLPPMDYEGDVEIRITDRQDNHFTAVYGTERGAYQWEVQGQIQASEIQWRVTRVLQAKEPRPQMLTAHSSGKLEGTHAKLTIYIPDAPGSTRFLQATMTLTRQ